MLLYKHLPVQQQPRHARVHRQSVPRVQRVSLRVQAVAEQAPPAEPRVKPEKEKGFINKMRMVAMKLHTPQQLGKKSKEEQEKEQEAAKMWQPTREGYLRFLVECKAVYDTMESIFASNDAYAAFRNTGLERSGPLAQDIAWFKDTYGLEAPAVKEDGPGMTYARLATDLAVNDPPTFICHFYNFYFAHTAGGRMIGKKMSDMLLDGAKLKFYEWEGDVQEHLDKVRKVINQMAESWTDEQKERCLAETEMSFKYSGGIMKCIGMDH